ncbi:MAG: RsmB/NOP family class I SAM-dependent RNA methyltransferase [Clostridia bacterium]|nr:RsmB/NOP family class I SAM-dependent RNA methyltransferase [Clostridia bacterium]
MRNLPQAFLDRMKKQLPEPEWESFLHTYEGAPLKGLRVNPLKCSKGWFLTRRLFVLEQVAWEENGFVIAEEKAGAHPYHFAGAYYLQEPSAMCAAPLLGVCKGERVLDLCSAPGGKGTRLAADLDGEGLIVLNEPIPNRAKILLENVERLGITNAVVTCAYPHELSKKFPAYFDKIMVDAPCSGEGMFRKNEKEAIGEWSEENVALCAARQADILDEAVKMLKKGGRLVYSTCTFSYEEDEGQVRDFLQKHPEMRLIESHKLYPHKVQGEGHFAALFEKTDGEEGLVQSGKPFVSAGKKKEYAKFHDGLFTTPVFDNLHEVGDKLYALPNGVFDFSKMNVLRVGIKLGEFVGGRFVPAHALATSTKAENCQNVVDMPMHDTRVDKYLRGETFEADGKDGWCLVCVDGISLGWGKRVNGIVKNHYPKGLRKVSK